ncbi:hypothetical protein V6N12_038422 [Hibiscus sabdariffa]|uniref:Uncharacterized protein n=1 Tax=Hibiscus sabdariffa TaxID=183260 RepID=A0ABR2BEZ4_9ROSI
MSARLRLLHVLCTLVSDQNMDAYTIETVDKEAVRNVTTDTNPTCAFIPAVFCLNMMSDPTSIWTSIADRYDEDDELQAFEPSETLSKLLESHLQVKHQLPSCLPTVIRI